MQILANAIEFLKNLPEEIFPFPFYLARKRKKLREAAAQNVLDRDTFAGYDGLSADQLTRRLEEERNRATAMDEKTFKMTLSLSIGMTVLGSIAAFLVKEIPYPTAQVALTVMIGISLIYILSAGFIAVGALKTLPSYGYGTRPLLLDDEKRQKALASDLAKQEIMNIIRHLRNETAYQALRNGLLLLFMSVAIFATSLAAETVDKRFSSSDQKGVQSCWTPGLCQGPNVNWLTRTPCWWP